MNSLNFDCFDNNFKGKALFNQSNFATSQSNSFEKIPKLKPTENRSLLESIIKAHEQLY